MDNPYNQPVMAIPASPYQTVGITKVSNGFIVYVGCKTFIAKTWTDVSEALALYYNNPEEARAKYCEDEPTVTTTTFNPMAIPTVRRKRAKLGNSKHRR